MNELFPFLEPPMFTNKPPPQVIIKRGFNLSLCCKATGSPRPRIEWSHSGQSSYLSPPFQENGCLEVNTFKENSDGDYICRATNQFGLAESTTTIIIVPFARGWVLYSHISYLFFKMRTCKRKFMEQTSNHGKVTRSFFSIYSVLRRLRNLAFS